ncbi:hypothetical protein NCF85_15835 (plasmid) [Qipengyuania citrea]|uniref:Spore coat protein U domain-containing protein n=1 Tax=Qipengyuania citrea TaxID=225971 RepID=A0ABY4UAU8_9SPHN|nr:MULTISPECIES: hypothetical protein [Qipengyuania]MBY8332626.1 hypothetical protein [Qipengyuania pacifica]USA63198.1 hypothetical protein NCF85_15835 [Qipengyuania citrea]
MKTILKAAAIVATPFLFASAAHAQSVTPDAEEYAIALSGSVDSNCELLPEGNGSYDVNMLETGNQGFLAIAYSCNSPYTVSLQSLNGGMQHTQSSVLIDYDVEAAGFLGIFNQTSTNSASMKTAPVVIVTNNDWENIATNGGVRTGNLDLSFDSLNEYAVAGNYEDTLTIRLAANF